MTDAPTKALISEENLNTLIRFINQDQRRIVINSFIDQYKAWARPDPTVWLQHFS